MKLKKAEFLFSRFLEPGCPLALAGRQPCRRIFLRSVQIAPNSEHLLSKDWGIMERARRRVILPTAVIASSNGEITYESEKRTFLS
jgi:hypothetical protein